MLLFDAGAHKGVEQRVTIPGRGFEFWMELHAHEPRMGALGQFNDFGELLALGERRDDQASLTQTVKVLCIGFVAMAMCWCFYPEKAKYANVPSCLNAI